MTKIGFRPWPKSKKRQKERFGHGRKLKNEKNCVSATADKPKTTKAEFRPRPKLHYLFIEQNCLDIVLICFLRNAFKKLGADCVVITRPALFAFIFLFHWKKTKVILSLEKTESLFCLTFGVLFYLIHPRLRL